MKTITQNPDLFQIAHDFIAADPGMAMLIGSIVLGSVIYFFQEVM